MLNVLCKVALGGLAVGVAGAALAVGAAVPTFAASPQATPASSLVLHLPGAAAHASGHIQPDPVYFYDPEED